MSPFLNGPMDLPPLPLLHVERPVEPPRILPPPPDDLPFLLDDAGSFLNLPPIGGPVGVNIPRISSVTNPGTTSPQDQGHRMATVDQTRSVTASTVPWINSNGQFQQADPGAGSKGVTVTRDVVPMQSFDGNIQLLNLAPTDQGMSSDSRPGGLPMEARPDSQSLVRQPKIWAEQLPVSSEVNADQGKPGGGLAKSHNIR